MSITPLQAAIAVAAAITGGTYWLFSRPRNLRHLPSISLPKFLWYVVTGKSRDEVARDVYYPAMAKTGVFTTWAFGTWTVMFTDPGAIKAITLDTRAFPKIDVIQRAKKSLVFELSGHSLLFKNGSEWRQQRHIVNPAFHRRWSTDAFGRVVRDLISALEANCSRPVKIVEYMHRATLDALGLLAFDYEFGSVRNPDNPGYKLYTEMMSIATHPIRIMFPNVSALPLPSTIKGRLLIREFNTIIYDIISKRRAEALKRKEAGISLDDEQRSRADLLTLMVDAAVKDNSATTDEEFRNNVILFYIAGHDTTANALSHVMLELARNSEVQERAREEAISVLGDAPDDIVPTSDQIRKMRYIDMVIKESQRKNPIVTFIAREVAEPRTINGVRLEPGMAVLCYIYGVHHDPRTYPDPEKFIPERFDDSANKAGDSSSGAHERIPFSWVPFGAGARQCLGMNFSLTEQRVFLSMLLRKFRWSLPDDSPYWHGTPSNALFINSPKKLQIVFEPRY